jgi:hypothetical protein
MPFINPLKPLVRPQTQKNYAESIVKPQLLRIRFFGEYSTCTDYELWISIFQAIDELVCSKNPNLLFYFLVFRSWGWNLTIVGGQPKMIIVASIVYVSDHFTTLKL